MLRIWCCAVLQWSLISGVIYDDDNSSCHSNVSGINVYVDANLAVIERNETVLPELQDGTAWGAYGHISNSNYKGTIVIGGTLSMDPNDSYYGYSTQMLNSIKMFLEWLNGKRGGILINGSRYAMRFRWVGDGSSEQHVTLAMAHALNTPYRGRADFAMSGYSSGLTEYASLQSGADGKLMIAANAAARRAFIHNNLTFGIDSPARAYLVSAAHALGEAASNTSKYKHPDGVQSLVAGFVQADEVFTRAVCEELPQVARDVGMQTYAPGVQTVLKEPQVSDLMEILRPLKDAGVNVLFGCTYYQTSIAIIAALERLDFSVLAVAFTSTLAMPAYGELISKGWWQGEYVLGVSPWHKSMPYKRGSFSNLTSGEFNTQYLERFGSPPSYHAAFTYAGWAVLGAAIEQARSLDTVQVAATMRTLRLREFIGEIGFDSNGQNNMSELVVLQYSPGSTKGESEENWTEIAQASIVYSREAISSSNLLFPMPTWAQRRCRALGPGKTWMDSAQPKDLDLLRSSVRNVAANECSGHGSCNEEGLCDCDDGWVGYSCGEAPSEEEVFNVIVIIVILIFVLAVCSLAICVHVYRARTNERPDRADSSTGAWVINWVGERVQSSLRKGKKIRWRNKAIHQAMRDNGTPTNSLGNPLDISEYTNDMSSSPSMASRYSTISDKRHRLSAWTSWRYWRQRFQRSAWVVNASPFRVQIEFASGADFDLSPGTFFRAKRVKPRKMRVRVHHIVDNYCSSAEEGELSRFPSARSTSGSSSVGTSNQSESNNPNNAKVCRFSSKPEPTRPAIQECLADALAEVQDFVSYFEIGYEEDDNWQDWKQHLEVTAHRSKWLLNGRSDSGTWLHDKLNLSSSSKASEKHNKICVYRHRLPDQNGKCMGDLRLVWKLKRDRKAVRANKDAILMISWSPPHTLRGMPIQGFESFLTQVVNCEGEWEHKKGMERNMYDVRKFFIARNSCCFDASYAELHTDFGPADVFVSHVWGETAANTKSAISSLQDMLVRRDPDLNLESIRNFRVWFCTACNNQVRVRHELGGDVFYSPFSQVLHSSHCKLVALVSPLMALERKWCNYEFCLAASLGLETLMVTKDGVIQAGQVAPKNLNEISQKIVDFHCNKATCSSQSDEELIDKAVHDMGGYDALDAKLKEVFHQAIVEALYWAQKARDRLIISPSTAVFRASSWGDVCLESSEHHHASMSADIALRMDSDEDASSSHIVKEASSASTSQSVVGSPGSTKERRQIAL